MGASAGVTSAVRALVRARAGEGCEVCGERPAQSVHHRVPRGMGGTRASWVNQPPNLLALCGSGTTGCHGFIEYYRDTAYRHGWLVRRGLILPAQVPALLYVQGVRQDVLLTPQGGYAHPDQQAA